MKVVAVLGSPNEKGNSSALVKEILRGATDAGHQIVTYWKDLQECGTLVVSSPNYYSQVTGPMITFMNRHYCLSDQDGKSRLHEGIKLIGVFAQGNGNAEAYRKQYEWYLGTFQKRGMNLVDVLISAGEDELMRCAYRTGKTL